MNCKNCDAVVESKFCPNCGQKADVHKITIGYVTHEFFHAITHADKGFLLLIKGLLTKPGIVAKEYIEGKRKKYFNPLSFLVITAALHFYATTSSRYYEGTSRNAGGGSERYHPMWQEVFQISKDNGKMLDILLLVPLITVVGRLLFRRPKYNLAEHFVLQSFVLGQGLNLRTFIFIPLFLLFPQYGPWNLMVFQITMLAFMVFAYKQFFQQNIFLTILKCMLVMVLYIVLYWASLFVYVYVKHLLF